MFTGIIETTGVVSDIRYSGGNRVLYIQSPLSHELERNQSVSHDGACFSVVETYNDVHAVTVIAESLERTTAGNLRTGDRVNLERAMRLNDRLDGHLVQGHVDTVAVCESREDHDGSTLFRFGHPATPDFITVKKGSVCVNGISLTVVDAGDDFFSVAIIPFTMQHTNLSSLEKGGRVNVEFDIIGKYLQRISGGARK